MKQSTIKGSIMKLMNLLFSILLAQSLIAQDTLVNYSASQSMQVCGRTLTGRGVFDSDHGFLCVNGKSRLYYEFSPNYDSDLGGVDNLIIGAYTNSTLATVISSSFRLFGPFSPTDNYASLIDANAVVPIETGSLSASAHTLESAIEKGKKYVLELTVDACEGYINVTFGEGKNPFFSCANDIPCENCLPKFQPVDDRYVVSAWVKELAGSTSGALNYTHSMLKVTSGIHVDTLYPAGQIIDGWQRIEGIIQTNSVGNLKMELIVSSGTSYFDDIRVFPYDGSVITYVYDPITLRLMAELDERNYAKIYEYDEEGKLVRVKKETEKGIMTIQENRENSSTND